MRIGQRESPYNGVWVGRSAESSLFSLGKRIGLATPQSDMAGHRRLKMNG